MNNTTSVNGRESSTSTSLLSTPIETRSLDAILPASDQPDINPTSPDLNAAEKRAERDKRGSVIGGAT